MFIEIFLSILETETRFNYMARGNDSFVSYDSVDRM